MSAFVTQAAVSWTLMSVWKLWGGRHYDRSRSVQSQTRRASVKKQRCLGADFYTGTRRHHPLALSPTLRRSFLCPRRGAAFAFKSVRIFQGRCSIFNYLTVGWFAGAHNCIAILTVVFNNGVMAAELDVLKFKGRYEALL